MSTRRMAAELVNALLSFGRIISTTLGTARSTLATIRGDEDVDAGNEEVPSQELWGSPAVLFRPANPTSEGACEVLFVRRGDELVGLAYRELRDIPLELQPGEVVVRAFGTQNAYVHLKPNNEVRIKGDLKVVVESAAAIELGTAALEPLVKGTTFGLFFNAHTHAGVTAGAGASGPPVVPMSGAQLSSKVKTE